MATRLGALSTPLRDLWNPHTCPLGTAGKPAGIGRAGQRPVEVLQAEPVVFAVPGHSARLGLTVHHQDRADPP